MCPRVAVWTFELHYVQELDYRASKPRPPTMNPTQNPWYSSDKAAGSCHFELSMADDIEDVVTPITVEEENQVTAEARLASAGEWPREFDPSRWRFSDTTSTV